MGPLRPAWTWAPVGAELASRGGIHGLHRTLAGPRAGRREWRGGTGDPDVGGVPGPGRRALAPPAGPGRRRSPPGHGSFMKRAARGAKKRAGGKKRGTFVHARETGPHEWVSPLREAAYARLVPRARPGAKGASPAALIPVAPEAPVKQAPERKALQKPKATPILFKQGKGQASPAAPSAGFRSRLHPAALGEELLGAPPSTVWQRRLSEYHLRRHHTTGRPEGHPAPPPHVRWTPLGPSVLMAGQALGRPAMGGRVAGIAIAPGGKLVYAASANGGVFRSDDGGLTWRPLMDAFDQN